jgi:hypothetical protein
MRPERITCQSSVLELPSWLSRPCCRVRRWREAAVVTVAVVTAVADTAVADISAEDISAEVIAGATASAACISEVATTAVRGSPSHIHFREGAFAAAVPLPVKAGGTSARSETPRCDPEASAAL